MCKPNSVLGWRGGGDECGGLGVHSVTLCVLSFYYSAKICSLIPHDSFMTSLVLSHFLEGAQGSSVLGYFLE